MGLAARRGDGRLQRVDAAGLRALMSIDQSLEQDE